MSVESVLENGVCAVVITFRPNADVLVNLAKARLQVEGLVAVDNGSSEEALGPLRTASSQLNFSLVENGKNLGIAAALNVGIRLALSQGFRWIILFDQDSTITDSFMSQMLEDFERERAQREVMLLVPRYQDPKTGIERVFPSDADGGPFITITSGSLLPAAAFEQCGYFQEELFIYTVDDEYSLRIRSKGYSIAQSKTAVLLHSSGFPSHHKFLGATFLTSNHSPGAHYYLNRNRIWMLRAYGSRYPRWAREVARACVVELLKIVLAEKFRWQKVKMITLGIRDGVLGRMGKTVTL